MRAVLLLLRNERRPNKPFQLTASRARSWLFCGHPVQRLRQLNAKLAGFRSGNGWRQASADPWGQDRDARCADGAWRVRPVARSSVATRGVRIAAGWPAPARQSGPWGWGRRMIRGAPRLGTAPGVPPVVRGAGSRVRRRGAVALLARATPVIRQSHPWGRGRRMARGGGRTIHPVALRPAMACASQASCVPAPAPV